MQAKRPPRSEHHFAADREWAAALQHALDETVRRRPGSPLATPAVEVIGVSKSGLEVEVTLTFRAGEMYCCMEPMCQLGAYSTRWWQTLRAALAEVSDRDPPPMTLTLGVVVERGALILSPDQSRAEPAEAHQYRTEPRHEREAR